MGALASTMLAVKAKENRDAARFWFFAAGLHIASITDAYSSAQRINLELRRKYGLEVTLLPGGVAVAYRF